MSKPVRSKEAKDAVGRRRELQHQLRELEPSGSRLARVLSVAIFLAVGPTVVASAQEDHTLIEQGHSAYPPEGWSSEVDPTISERAEVNARVESNRISGVVMSQRVSAIAIASHMSILPLVTRPAVMMNVFLNDVDYKLDNSSDVSDENITILRKISSIIITKDIIINSDKSIYTQIIEFGVPPQQSLTITRALSAAVLKDVVNQLKILTATVESIQDSRGENSMAIKKLHLVTRSDEEIIVEADEEGNFYARTSTVTKKSDNAGVSELTLEPTAVDLIPKLQAAGLERIEAEEIAAALEPVLHDVMDEIGDNFTLTIEKFEDFYGGSLIAAPRVVLSASSTDTIVIEKDSAGRYTPRRVTSKDIAADYLGDGGDAGSGATQDREIDLKTESERARPGIWIEQEKRGMNRP